MPAEFEPAIAYLAFMGIISEAFFYLKVRKFRRNGWRDTIMKAFYGRPKLNFSFFRDSLDLTVCGVWCIWPSHAKRRGYENAVNSLPPNIKLALQRAICLRLFSGFCFACSIVILNIAKGTGQT